VRINQIIAAFNAYRNLQTTAGQPGESLEELSCGLRINHAAHDAPGPAKPEGFRSDFRVREYGLYRVRGC